MGKFDLIFEIDRRIITAGMKVQNLIRLPEYLQSKKVRMNNSTLITKKQSNKCYIIGLGPSLKTIDLTKLKGDTIVTNRFYKFDRAKDLAPTFYCLLDEAFYHNSHIQETLGAIHTFRDTTFIMNGKFLDQASFLFGDTQNDFYGWLGSGYLNDKSEIDFTKRLPFVNNIVLYGIMLAIYLRYDEIILLGCDFSSFASQNQNHCYKDDESERKWTMAYELFAYSFAADSHNRMNDYAMKKNVKILNATQGSLIDAYERLDDISDILL